VIAVCGQLSLDRRRLAEAGIAAAYALSDVEPDLERCMREAGPLLERLAAVLAGSGAFRRVGRPSASVREERA